MKVFTYCMKSFKFFNSEYENMKFSFLKIEVFEFWHLFKEKVYSSSNVRVLEREQKEQESEASHHIRVRAIKEYIMYFLNSYS